MNLLIVTGLLGRFFKGFSLALLPCLLVALYDDYGTGSYAPSLSFTASAAICLGLGAALQRGQREKREGFYRKEAIALVALIWMCASLAGTLPYLLSGYLHSPIDALFESVSGFTTTGSTILESKLIDPTSEREIARTKASSAVAFKPINYYGTVHSHTDKEGHIKEGIEALPRSLVLWRSLTQWLGGGGIVVLFLTILPLAGIGGKVLFQSEVTGPNKEGITPRIKETAHILWSVYLVLSVTLLSWILLAAPEIGWFNALNLTLATISTGGFATYNASIGHFNNARLEWILTLFMLCGSINFYLFYHLWRRRFSKLLDVELILFLSIIAVGSLFCSWSLWGHNVTWLDGRAEVLDFFTALRAGTFQFISLISSTGFATINFDIWPPSTQLMLFIGMCLGGMSGSTSGGIKVIRIYIIIRYILYRLRALIRPEAVEAMRFHGAEMDLTNISMVLTFFCITVLCGACATVFFIFCGLDPESSISLANCFLNNTGQAFRLAGPSESCAFLPPVAKIISCFMMLLGRLEYFTLFVVMMPSFWKSR